MSIGIFNDNIELRDGTHHTFLNTPFKQCVDFIFYELDIPLELIEKEYKSNNKHNIIVNNIYKDKIKKLLENFNDNVVIESNFNSCFAIGKLRGDNYTISSKSKYFNDENSKKIMFSDFKKFISKSKLYKKLIKDNSLILSVPRNRNNKNTFDLSEWITEEISNTFSLNNITELLSFYKDGDLKPTILDNGNLVHKTIEEKESIINNSTLKFDKNIEQYKNKKIILIDNIHDSGITTEYILKKLKEVIQPNEIHCLYYSKM